MTTAKKTETTAKKLKNAQAVIHELQIQSEAATQKINALEKTQEELTKAKATFYESMQKKDQELDEIHTLLDNLPGSIPKRIEGTYRDVPVMARLASWFAVRSFPGGNP